MVDTTCPAYRVEGCFLLGIDCGVNHKEDCTNYRLYVPKRPITRSISEVMSINQHLPTRMGNPLGAIEKALGEFE